MTKKYFFDTDCLSAFLWVGKDSIISSLYSGNVIIPMQVYNEIQSVPHLLSRVDFLKNSGIISVECMQVGSNEFIDYIKMTTSPESGMRIIGNGEAAGIAMARNRNGILASNNFRDISPYVKRYSIELITTGDILIQALRSGIITEAEGNIIWTNMLSKRRWLPTSTFTEYLERSK